MRLGIIILLVILGVVVGAVEVMANIVTILSGLEKTIQFIRRHPKGVVASTAVVAVIIVAGLAVGLVNPAFFGLGPSPTPTQPSVANVSPTQPPFSTISVGATPSHKVPSATQSPTLRTSSTPTPGPTSTHTPTPTPTPTPTFTPTPSPTPTYTPVPVHNEISPDLVNTWSDYTDAGGTHGPSIPANQWVQVACTLTGFRVADGNTWWYRLASSPWNNQFYASADAFCNNGQACSNVADGPFVDPSVPHC